jgi:hypothetical protein
VGKGTHPNVNGGQTLVLTEELNADFKSVL